MAWSTEFESGLIDDFDFTITRAYFAPDAKYNNGETTLLHWEGTTDSLDTPQWNTWYPVGKGWVSKDGGKTVVHESGKEGKYFNKQSAVAVIIKRCVEEFGIGDLLEERGTPFDSNVWAGLSFHMKSETTDYGGVIGEKSRTLPVRFLGGNGNGKVARSAVTSNGTAEKLAALKAQKAAGADGSLRDQVIAELKKHDNFTSAQDAALAIDGVTDDDDLLTELLDESGLWSQVGAAA